MEKKIKIDHQIVLYITILSIISYSFIYSSSSVSGQYAGSINFIYKQ